MKRVFFSVLTAPLLLAGVAPNAQAQAQSSATVAPALPAPLNPASINIAAVQFEGFSAFDPNQLAGALANQLGIKAGASVPSARLEEGRRRIALTYAEAGYPFTPEVKLTTTPLTTAEGAGGVTVKYSVSESAPLSRVQVSGVTLIGAAKLQSIFKPMTDAKRLTAAGYDAALTELAQAYSAGGYVFRAEDVQTNLDSGVLSVQVTEPFVASVETSALRLPSAPALSTRKGTGLSITALNDDARTLSNLTGQGVVWQAQPVSAQAGQVRVSFAPLAGAAERIKRIVIQGNDHVSTANILKVLRLREGDVATPQLAQQDFYAIQKLYDDLGYALAATEDSLSFDGGVLAFHLREAKVAGYDLKWPAGKPLLNEQVTLRILPSAGSTVQRQQMRQALAQLQGYDNVQLVGQDTRVDDPARPEKLTFVLTFAEKKRSAPVSAALSYSAQEGLGGEGTFGTNNLFGSGRGLNLTLGANANDVGQYFSGSVNYSIPWINSNFLDFAKRPTSLDLSAWSSASGNNTLYVKGSDGLATNTDTGRQYTVRSTGVTATAGRSLGSNLTGTAGVTVAQSRYTLEPYKASDSSSGTTTGSTYQTDSAASAQLPLGAVTAMPSLGLRYDTTDSAQAPSFGVRAQTTLGYGVGRQSDGTGLSWGQVEAGGSTYFGFGRTMPDGSKQEVIAGRVNAGTIVGNGGEGNVFSIGSGTVNPAYELRGPSSVLHGTSYLTTSAELRHNFGVSIGDYVTGVYGLAFVDAGDAWTYKNNSNPFGLNLAYGVGAQVNSSFLNFQVAYGLNTSGSGKFSLRLGRFW